RNTIAVHRPALLIEVNRVHQALRGIDFNKAVPSLLPKRYFFAELRASGIVRMQNLTECVGPKFSSLSQKENNLFHEPRCQDSPCKMSNGQNGVAPIRHK